MQFIDTKTGTNLTTS